jgi:hypothetical protein
MDGLRSILKCVFYCFCFCGWFNRSIETLFLQGILCFTYKLLGIVAVICLASVQYLQMCKSQNHSLQDVIMLLLINMWSCFRNTSKQTVEVILSPVHATRLMCVTVRIVTVALRVYLVSRRQVKFHSRSECTGKEKHLLSVPGI